MLTKDELSDFIGTQIATSGPAGGKVPDGASACSYSSGEGVGLPGALLEVSETHGEALMASCRGVVPLEGLGDHAFNLHLAWLC